MTSLSDEILADVVTARAGIRKIMAPVMGIHHAIELMVRVQDAARNPTDGELIQMAAGLLLAAEQARLSASMQRRNRDVAPDVGEG